MYNIELGQWGHDMSVIDLWCVWHGMNGVGWLIGILFFIYKLPRHRLSRQHKT
jgi:hypothetical protein